MIGTFIDWGHSLMELTWLHLMTVGAVILFLIFLRLLSGLLPWTFPILLPGVFTHELSHFVLGYVVCARPVWLSVWPTKVGNSWVLGRVRFANLRGFNTAPAVLAPMLLLPLGLWGVSFAFVAKNWLEWGWWVVMGGYVIWASMPSDRDVWLAVRSLFSITGLILLLSGTLFIIWHWVK